MRRRESSDHQQRLANDVTGLDRAVRVGSLLQRESLPDDRPDPSRGRLPHRPLSKQPGIHRRKLYVLDPPHGYVAPPGLLEVDRREPAAWRAWAENRPPRAVTSKAVRPIAPPTP